MISVRDIVKEYIDDGVSTRALDGVSFDIQQGEFVSIMGPSGSGKSTLLHVLSFLDRPTEGEYVFMNKRMSELTDQDLAHIRNGSIGFIFQSFNLLSRATVYENVEMPLIYNEKLPHHKRKHIVEKAIASVGLAEKTYAEAGKLSGGQKQRVAIARALVNDPDVIFADEPTGNLDSKSGAQVMEILEKLNQDGRTVILVTHETFTAEFAGRLIKMRDGRVESDEPLPKHRRTKEDFFK